MQINKYSFIPLVFALLPFIGWVAFVFNSLPMIQILYLVPGSLVSLALLGVGGKTLWSNDFLILIILMAFGYVIGFLILKGIQKFRA